MSLSLYSINAFLILDHEGKRILTKYYDSTQLTKLNEQKKFEISLFKKLGRVKGLEISLYDGHVIIYRTYADFAIYLVGNVEENEILLSKTLEGFLEALTSLLGHALDAKGLIENIDIVALTLDEVIDQGIILEVDPEKIESRVSKRGQDVNELQINEQTLFNAFNNAKERLARNLLS